MTTLQQLKGGGKMKSKRHLFTIGSMVFMLFLLSSSGWAQGRSVEVINYQGKLTDSGGNPIDGNVTASFALFDTATPAPGENPLWAERDITISVEEGIYNVELGSTIQFPSGLFDDYDDLYLRVTVSGEELGPLQHLTSTAYAMKAVHADTATNVANGMLPGDLFVVGRVGIGTPTPRTDLEIEGTDGLRVTTGQHHNVFGEFKHAYSLGLVINANAGGGWADMRFQTDGIDRMFIESGGNVGIGTTEPNGPLHVESSININSGSNFADKIAPLVVGNGDDPTGTTLLIDANQIEQSRETDNLYLNFNSQADVILAYGGGKVGIGTSSPDTKVEIHGDGSSWAEGFLIIKNEDEDAGIRLYDSDTEIKHHIFNDNAFFDSLRIVSQGAYTGGGITITQSGNVGIGTGATVPTSRLTVKGNLAVLNQSSGALVAEIGEGLDYAEGFDVSNHLEVDVKPGAVLVIDPEHPGKLVLSTEAYDTKVAGIVAGANGLGSGVRLGGAHFDHDVALAGRVYCMVDATETGVKPGDLLTTAATTGYAMKATDYARAHGAILGKAMQRMEKGNKGQILVLVTLQ
jgi:hypothetical protein